MTRIVTIAATMAMALHTIWRTDALSQPLAVGDVDAVDHRDAEPVQHGRDRQQERVGVARDEAHRDVQPEHEGGEAGPSSTSCVSMRPIAPSCTSTIAAALMMQATMSSQSSMFRSFCGRRMRRTERWAARSSGAPRRCGRRGQSTESSSRCTIRWASEKEPALIVCSTRCWSYVRRSATSMVVSVCSSCSEIGPRSCWMPW